MQALVISLMTYIMSRRTAGIHHGLKGSKMNIPVLGSNMNDPFSRLHGFDRDHYGLNNHDVSYNGFYEPLHTEVGDWPYIHGDRSFPARYYPVDPYNHTIHELNRDHYSHVDRISGLH